MTETDKREQVARLEARLRGGEVYFAGDEPQDDWVMVHTSIGYRQPNGGLGDWTYPTPHDTDAGRLEWMELLAMTVHPHGSKWQADLDHIVYAKAIEDSAAEAITAAVEAAAQEVRG